MRLYNHVLVCVNTSHGAPMNYTGLEKHTNEELSRMAYGSSNRVAIELAKRIEGLQPAQKPYHEEIEAAALRGVGVNPIPLNIGEEE